VQLLLIWLACGTVTAAVMIAGFHTKFGVLTPRLWAHAALAVIIWPIGLLSASLTVSHPKVSRALERYTGAGLIDAFFDWRDLRALRRRGGDGGSLAYLRRDFKSVDGKGKVVDLAAYEDVVMDPEVFVQLGGTLPSGRPDGSALIRVRRGAAEWEAA
jgi:DNA-binding transcriptional ArsR family regulator